MAETPQDSAALVQVLHQVLNYLKTNPHPHVPTPAGCKKRASVAVVLRIRPKFTALPEVGESTVELHSDETQPTTLDEFFSQKWVLEGDPEALFIKRAGRDGDRWSGHVALPGGKRDPEDESDVAAAIRETREEVGLDLSTSQCLYGGNLPERIVATTWGRAALMVLCPYVFVLTHKDTPRVRPQPTEVASAHWVPLRALLSPNLRTREYVDTASRMAKQGGKIAQILLRTVLGKMVFSAIQLAPSESIFAPSIQGFIPEQAENHIVELMYGAVSQSPPLRELTYQAPLLLWGLTLGVLADFLDMLPPYNAVKLWRYPTFTTIDLRLLVYVCTYSIRKKQVNPGDFSGGTWPYHTRKPSDTSSQANQTAIDATTQAIAVTEAEPRHLSQMIPNERQNEVGIGGLGVGSPKDAVGRLLAGYYERLNVAIFIFLAYRTLTGSALAYWGYRLWHRRRGLRG